MLTTALVRQGAKYATAVIEALGAIASKPHRPGKSVRFELTGRWAARRGPYRIVYAKDDESRTVAMLATSEIPATVEAL